MVTDLIPAGYFPKITEPRPQGWLANETVVEVCSVSEHISSGPEDWIAHWRHNRAGFYRTEAEAWSVAGDDRGRFDMYAYTLYPAAFGEDGEASPFDEDDRLMVDDLAGIEPTPADFDLLGFDAVCQSCAWGSATQFDCSPLTCNGMASEVPVNRYALLATLDEALAAARKFGVEQPEPGTYYVLAVWRKRRPMSARPP